jgi:predicted NAD-dependent protein-ADP-ribosyltransferase YbiA (DUF1768 family)
MGGPCKVLEDDGSSSQPECTDNFQVKPFVLDGKEWQSVEQCFQAIKFESDAVREQIRAVKPSDGEGSWSYGIKCARAGQVRDLSFRKDWDGVRAECMYRINRAKFAANADAREELLATGSKPLKHEEAGYWGVWNTNVMLRIREELKPPDQVNEKLLAELVSAFSKELTGNGDDLPTLAKESAETEGANKRMAELQVAQKKTESWELQVAQKKMESWCKTHGYGDVHTAKTTMRGKKKYALHTAVKREDGETVKLLLLCGANKNAKDSKGETALQLAQKMKPGRPRDVILDALR